MEEEERGHYIKSSSTLQPSRELTLTVLCSSPGQEYHLLTPKFVPRGSGTVSCPHCQPVRTQDAGKGWKQPCQRGCNFFPQRVQSGQMWACPELRGGSKVCISGMGFSRASQASHGVLPSPLLLQWLLPKATSLTLTWRNHGQDLRRSRKVLIGGYWAAGGPAAVIISYLHSTLLLLLVLSPKPNREE